MARIVVSENVTLDGVMQDPSGEEGFAFGGWFGKMSDDDRTEWAKVEFKEALDCEAMLLGRVSYNWFAKRWADRPGEWADRLRAMPKYVVSSTLERPTEWANATILKGDVIETVSKLKQSMDGDIVVYASGPLVQTLIEYDLVDKLRLMTHPFVLGAGERIFREPGVPKSLRLLKVCSVGSNLALLTYQVKKSS
jgi:dihydrofolate reductase